jgi:hypothetical protein
MGHCKGRAGGRPAFAMTFCIGLAPSWFIIRKPLLFPITAMRRGWGGITAIQPLPPTPITITKYLLDSIPGMVDRLAASDQCHQRKSVVRICFS